MQIEGRDWVFSSEWMKDSCGTEVKTRRLLVGKTNVYLAI